MTQQNPTEPAPPPPAPPPPAPLYTQPRQGPPSGTAGQAAMFWLVWLPLAILLWATLIGLPILIGVNARRLGYRGHDFRMRFIPYYGIWGFMPKMMWRLAHVRTPYWSYAP